MSKNTSHPIQTSYLESVKQSTGIEIFSNVEFRVYFYGTDTDYLTLYIDNIIVYDERGYELLTQTPKQLDIIHQATNYNNINQFTTDQTAFDTTVVGWFAVDEPSFIDNFECVKKVAELLKNNGTNKKLVVSIAGSWNGRVYAGSNVFRIDELMKRTGIEDVIMNNLIFDYPFNDNTSDYANLNIANMLDNHLNKLNNYDVPFVLALQVGKWKALEDLLEKIPTQEQLLYTMNAGLLYGAKGICISNYFYNSDSAANTTALYDFTLDNYSPLWGYIKNDLSPRLKGVFGQKIKGLQQLIQWPNINANQSPVIDYEFVNSVGTVNNTQQLSCVLDLGFFSDSEESTKYFMAVNRYYSEFENIVFNFQELATYKNWEVTNFVTNTKATIAADNNNAANYTVSIPKGDAGLYGLVPVVKCGGTLIINEIITGSLQLGGNITVPTGVTLTIASGSTINLNGYYIKSTGGSITVVSGTTVNGALLKTGGIINAIYPSIQSAISVATSGQIVQVISPLTISSDVSVSSGITLLTSDNAELTFASGKKISVLGGGNLTANNTTFQGNGTAGSWYALYFYANSSGSFQSCTIKDAVCGIYCNTVTNLTVTNSTIRNNSLFGFSIISSSTPTITNCIIQNNGTGISSSSSRPVITGCTIENNTNYGISANNIDNYYPHLFWCDNTFNGNGYAMLLNNASPYIYNSTISDNYHGVTITSGLPNFADPSNQWRGYNAITCNMAIPNFKADNYSYVYMGYGYDGGYNSIFGSELPDMEAYNNSDILACNNFWGIYSPAICADATSTILAWYPLSSDPNPSSCSLYKSPSLAKNSSSTEESNLSGKYLEAIVSGYKNDFNAAKNLLKSLIEDKFDSKYSPLALLAYYNLDSKDKELNGTNVVYSLDDILKSVYNRSNDDPLRPFAVRLLARKAALQNKTDEMTAYNTEIIENYPNSSNEVSALYDLVNYYYVIEEDNVTANKYLKKMAEAYPDNDLTLFAKVNLGLTSFDLKKSAGTSIEQIPDAYSLEDNFPNPFNPTTTINYSIPNDEKVVLKVYDVLGSEIATLVNEQKAAGKYDVNFDASSLSSGVYIYKIQAGNFINSKKMILLK